MVFCQYGLGSRSPDLNLSVLSQSCEVHTLRAAKHKHLTWRIIKKAMAKRTKKLFSIILILFVILYGLSWVVYGFKYSHYSQIVLQHYGGLNTYACTGTAALGQPEGRGYIKIHPTSYVLLSEGISYTIKYGSGPNIATGTVSFLGKMRQTNIQYSSDPVCTLL